MGKFSRFFIIRLFIIASIILLTSSQALLGGELEETISKGIARKLRVLLSAWTEADQEKAILLLSQKNSNRLPNNLAYSILNLLRESEVKKLRDVKQEWIREYVDYYFKEKIYRTSEGKQQLGRFSSELIQDINCLQSQLTWLKDLPYQEVHLTCRYVPVVSNRMARALPRKTNLTSLEFLDPLIPNSSAIMDFHRIRSSYLRELHVTLKHVTLEDLIRFSEHFPELVSLSIRGIEEIDPHAFSALHQFRKLRSLRLGVHSRWSIFKHRHFQEIGRLQNLKSFELLGRASMDLNSSRNLLKSLVKIRNLVRLNLQRARLDQSAFRRIRGLLQLKALSLNSTTFDPNDLQVLEGHPSLMYLDLQGSSFLENLDSTYSIPDLPSLEDLYLFDYRHPYFAQSLELLGNLTHLKSLSVALWMLSQDDLSSIKTLFPNLTQLNLSGVLLPNQESALQILDRLNQLQHLNISIVNNETLPLSNNAFLRLARIKNLTALEILHPQALSTEAAWELSQVRTLKFFAIPLPATRELTWIFRKGNASFNFLRFSEIEPGIAEINLRMMPGIVKISSAPYGEYRPSFWMPFQLNL